MWKNIGLQRYKTADVNTFTSNVGIRIRRCIHHPMRYMLRKSISGRIIVESFPTLKKDEPYIFAATHSFVEEVQTLLAVIDRSVYSLMGATDQLEHNPKAYIQWLMGMVYVDRNSETSRKQSMAKMKRILESGSSMLVFPEGGWNNTENLLVQALFPGVYNLAKNTKKKVVPICCYKEFGKKDIYVNAADPIDLSIFEKEQGLIFLRDKMATLMYNSIEAHSEMMKRSSLPDNMRKLFMKQRKAEYLKINWTKDVWDEELTVYKDRLLPPSPYEVCSDMARIKLSKTNAVIVAPFVFRLQEYQTYDFKCYMKSHWMEKG